MQQDFMKTKPVLRLLMSMGIPMVLSMLIQSLYNIVDSIWVAKLGTDALTAVSLAFPMQNVVLSISVGIGVGISSVISISLGAGDHDRANRAASLGIALTLVHCVLFVIFGILTTKPFLSMFTDNPYIFDEACKYTYTVVCVSFGNLLQITIEKIFQAIGKMTVTMLLMASGCIINIVLDPILIFGWFGMPAMGVLGAAVATVIGQIAATVLYIIVYLKSDISVKISTKYMKPDFALIKRIYGIGIPSSLMIAMPSVLVGVLNGVLAKISAVYVAVFGLYYKLQTFIYMPAGGLVQGMRPIVSYNYGAKMYKRVWKTIYYSMAVIALIMLVGTIGSMFFPEAILSLFDADEELLKYGAQTLRIISCGFIISTVGVVCSGVFEALGKGRQSLTVSLLRQFVITIPLGVLLSLKLGAVGIWIAFPVSEAIAAVAAYIMLLRVKLPHENIDTAEETAASVQ